jgi:hypothetical protein
MEGACVDKFGQNDAIFGIHYLADYLGKYILAGDIISFDMIYYESMNKIESEKN